MVRPVVSSAISAGLDEYFHAGQAHHHLVFSTAQNLVRDMLYSGPPRVVVSLDEEFRLFLAYVDWDVSNLKLERRDFVDPDSALVTFKAYLSQLWGETRPNQHVPAVLDEASLGLR
jgi:hypothetical protein